MITKELVEKYNGTEWPFIGEGMSKPVNCIVLVKEGVGVSIKPLIHDDEEMENFIHDVMVGGKISRERAIALISDPKYCLATMGYKVDEEKIKSLIEGGGYNFEPTSKDVPECFFA